MKGKRNPSTWLVAAVVLGAAGGLSCADGNGVGGYSSGIDPNKSFATLTPADKEQLCTSIGSYGAQNSAAERDSSCRESALLSARTAADPVATCNMRYSACVMDISPSTPNTSECMMDTAASTTCPVTIGTFETCVNQVFAEQSAAYAAVPTCDKASATYQEPQRQNQAIPPCYADIIARCPELFGNQSTTNQQAGATGTGGASGAQR